MKHPIPVIAASALLALSAFAADAPKSAAATAPAEAAAQPPAGPAAQPKKKKKLMEKAEQAFSDFGDQVAGVLKADPKDSQKPAPEQAKDQGACSADSKAADCHQR